MSAGIHHAQTGEFLEQAPERLQPGVQRPRRIGISVANGPDDGHGGPGKQSAHNAVPNVTAGEQRLDGIPVER